MTEAVVYPSFVRAEIENWIAWCWQGEGPEPREPSRCYSAERDYRVIDSNSEDTDPPSAKPIIYEPSAIRVQALFDAMPPLTRRVLQYEYTNRARYDQWERSVEMYEGELRPVWIRTGNIKRQRAKIDLKVSRRQYMTCVDEFNAAVYEEFAVDVPPALKDGDSHYWRSTSRAENV